MNSLQPLAPCSVEKRRGLVWEGAAALGVRALVPLLPQHHSVTLHSSLLLICKMRDGWIPVAPQSLPRTQSQASVSGKRVTPLNTDQQACITLGNS